MRYAGGNWPTDVMEMEYYEEVTLPKEMLEDGGLW